MLLSCCEVSREFLLEATEIDLYSQELTREMWWNAREALLIQDYCGLNAERNASCRAYRDQYARCYLSSVE